MGSQFRTSRPTPDANSGNKSNDKHSGSKKNSTDTNKRNGSCLIACLKFFGLLMLIPFGWIGGIIWFVFYRKKLGDDPVRQKILSVLVAIGSVLSFIIMVAVYATAPPEPETIILSSDAEEQQLMVGEEYTLAATLTPTDAGTSSLKFVMDNSLYATIDQSDDIPTQATLVPKREGTINIYAEAGDVESNILTFEIVEPKDNTITESETETETIPNTEIDVEENTEANTDISTEAPINETESASEEISLSETPETTDTPDSNNIVAVPETPSSETQEQAVSNEASQELVWIDDTAKRYHRKNGCGMDNAYQVTLEEAIAADKTPCGRCY